MLIIMDGTLATLPNTAIMDKNSNMKLEALLIGLLMGGYDLANQCSSPETPCEGTASGSDIQ